MCRIDSAEKGHNGKRTDNERRDMMNSLKFILGLLALALSMVVIAALIWIALFGIPQGEIDGGTLVSAFSSWREVLW